MRAILPIGVSLADQSKVRLVDQSGRLQDVPLPLAPKSSRRPAAKLLLHHHNELVPRRKIASAPRVKQSRHVVIGIVQMILRFLAS
jgi:hypothetical protein